MVGGVVVRPRSPRTSRSRRPGCSQPPCAAAAPALRPTPRTSAQAAAGRAQRPHRPGRSRALRQERQRLRHLQGPQGPQGLRLRGVRPARPLRRRRQEPQDGRQVHAAREEEAHQGPRARQAADAEGRRQVHQDCAR